MEAVRITSLGLAYSIKQFIEKEAELCSVIKFDGILLPTEKPYFLIEEFPTTNQSISKGRELIKVTTRFRLGIVAGTAMELSEYSEKIDDLLLFHTGIQYYNSSGVPTNYSFTIEADYMKSPEFSDDKSKDIDKHRVFYDIEITTNKHANK